MRASGFSAQRRCTSPGGRGCLWRPPPSPRGGGSFPPRKASPGGGRPGGSRQRRWRSRRGGGGPEVEEALLAGEVEVHPVPELVGEGVGAVQVVRVVEEDVGVGGGKPPRAEGPAPFAGPRVDVYPALLKELPGDFRKLGGETAEGLQHQGPRLGKGHLGLLPRGARRSSLGVFSRPSLPAFQR